jgi:hypothetical protein
MAFSLGRRQMMSLVLLAALLWALSAAGAVSTADSIASATVAAAGGGTATSDAAVAAADGGGTGRSGSFRASSDFGVPASPVPGVVEEFEFFILKVGVTICSLALMPAELILLAMEFVLDELALDRCEDTGLTYVSITALFFLPPSCFGVAGSV